MSVFAAMRFLSAVMAAVWVARVASGVVVLEDITLIDGTGAKAKAHQSIVIEDGKISRIVPAPNVSGVPAGAHVMKLSGKTVMPGIINSHGHLGVTKSTTTEQGNYTEANIAAQLSQYERYGITTMMSLGLNKDSLHQIRARQEKGEIGGASILTADHGLGTAGGAEAGSD